MKLADAHACVRCALAQTRTQVVIGSGPTSSRLIVVGEAPGKTEDEGGAPFIGRSGQLFFSLLQEELGLTRDDCYITNVVKCRPPGNRTPTRREITACSQWLDLQRETWSHRVVVALGLTAARTLTGRQESMAALHGQVHQVDDFSVIPTYHPAAALRQGPSVVAVMRADLAIVKAELS
jgi:DNA polymerase